MNDKLLITETGEIITISDYLATFNEMKISGIVVGDAASNLEYSIKNGIIQRVKTA